MHDSCNMSKFNQLYKSNSNQNNISNSNQSDVAKIFEKAGDVLNVYLNQDIKFKKRVDDIMKYIDSELDNNGNSASSVNSFNSSNDFAWGRKRRKQTRKKQKSKKFHYSK